MIVLPDRPTLVWPTTTVRTSYLVGELADCRHRGTPTDWLREASEDFDGFVAVRRGVRERWGVPSTVYWWVAGEFYLGTLVVRHDLTPELTEVGGHVGYHVVFPWRRLGHATAMLASGLEKCRELGLDWVLVTCESDNGPSRRAIVSNGGVQEDTRAGEDRFWIDLG